MIEAPDGAAPPIPAARSRRAAAGDPRRLRRHDRPDRRVGHRHGRIRAGRLGGRSRRIRRRADRLAAADDPRDVDGGRRPGRAACDRRRPAARPGFVPFVRRAQAAGIPVEVVSDGFGFFIEPALEALGVGELPVVTARTTSRAGGRRSRSRTATRLPRLRDVQAQPRPRPPGRRPCGRLHRRRRERSIRRRLQRRRLREARARPHLPRGRLAVPALDRIRARSTRGWPTWSRLGRPIRRLSLRAPARTRSSAALRSGATAALIHRLARGRPDERTAVAHLSPVAHREPPRCGGHVRVLALE